MDTRDAMQGRIALAPQEARTHGQYLEHTLECLAELLGSEASEEIRASFPLPKETGAFNCLAVESMRLTDVAASLLEQRAGISYAQALERIGTCVGRRLLESPIGKALWGRAGRDMHEVMTMSMVSARASTTYGNRSYTKLGPTSARLSFQNELMGPAWVRGLYLHAFQVMSGGSVSVTVEDCRALGMDFNLHISW
jgi:uncharacterized protein (TIGR02265 family)